MMAIGRYIQTLHDDLRRSRPNLWHLQTIYVLIVAVAGSSIAGFVAYLMPQTRQTITPVEPGFWILLFLCTLAFGWWVIGLTRPIAWQQISAPPDLPRLSLLALHALAVFLPALTYGVILQYRGTDIIGLEEARIKFLILRDYQDANLTSNLVALLKVEPLNKEQEEVIHNHLETDFIEDSISSQTLAKMDASLSITGLSATVVGSGQSLSYHPSFMDTVSGEIPPNANANRSSLYERANQSVVEYVFDHVENKSMDEVRRYKNEFDINQAFCKAYSAGLLAFQFLGNPADDLRQCHLKNNYLNKSHSKKVGGADDVMLEKLVALNNSVTCPSDNLAVAGEQALNGYLTMEKTAPPKCEISVSKSTLFPPMPPLDEQSAVVEKFQALVQSIEAEHKSSDNEFPPSVIANWPLETLNQNAAPIAAHQERQHRAMIDVLTTLDAAHYLGTGERIVKRIEREQFSSADASSWFGSYRYIAITSYLAVAAVYYFGIWQRSGTRLFVWSLCVVGVITATLYVTTRIRYDLIEWLIIAAASVAAAAIAYRSLGRERSARMRPLVVLIGVLLPWIIDVLSSSRVAFFIIGDCDVANPDCAARLFNSITIAMFAQTLALIAIGEVYLALLRQFILRPA